MKGIILIFTIVICVKFLNAGHYIGDFYFSHPLKLTWWEASRFCTFYGEDLIDIPDEREYRNILNVIEKFKEKEPNFVGNIWTSGVRFNVDKWFYWENTGMPVVYIDWMPGDPHLRPDENFLALFGSQGFKLADIYNHELHAFMCRKRKPPVNQCQDCCNLNRCNSTYTDDRVHGCSNFETRLTD